MVATHRGNMETEKKPNEPDADQPKPEQPNQNIGDIVGDLVVSGATMLANTAAKAVVNRVKKAAGKTKPINAVAKAVKKAKTSAAAPKATKGKKAKKALKKTGKKSAGKKAGKKSAKKSTKKSTNKSK